MSSLDAKMKVGNLHGEDKIRNVPPNFRPNLKTYGKGIFEVKLKQIVSNIKRSTASSR